MILDNTVAGNALEGIYLLGSHGNLIAGNTVRDHGAAGIYVKDSDRNTLDANTLINDPLHVVYGSTQNVLTGNTIVGQQIRFKEASDNQVHGMTVRTEGGKPSVAYELMGSRAEPDRRFPGHGAVGLRHPRHVGLDGQCLRALRRDVPPRLLHRHELERARQQRQRRRPGLRKVAAPGFLSAPPGRRRARPDRVRLSQARVPVARASIRPSRPISTTVGVAVTR